MEKEKILSELKSKLGKTQLSDRTLNAYLDQNLPAEGVEPDEAYYEKHVSFLKSLQGQFNADVAQQVNAYMAAHPKGAPEPNPTPADPPKTDDPVLAALQAEVEALKKANKEQAEAAKRSQMRGELKNKGAELNVANRALWEDVVAAIAIGEKSTPESILAEAKSSYESKLKSYIGDGAAPYGSVGVALTEDLKGDLESFADHLRDIGKLPPKEAK